MKTYSKLSIPILNTIKYVLCIKATVAYIVFQYELAVT